MDLVRLNGVGFTYSSSEQAALEDVTVTIPTGAVTAVLGANASGKSTLCALVRGLIPHFHTGEVTGEVTILGERLESWDTNALSALMGYVFQNPFTQISGIKETVFEEVGFGLENLGRPVEEIIDGVRRAVALVGIESILDRNPNELSGGQRQKVAFASVLAMGTDHVVLDEPTSQLDPESSEEIFGIIQGLKDAGKTVVLAEHKLDLVARHADHVVVLDQGRVRAAGPAEEVLTSPDLLEMGVPYPEITALAREMERRGSWPGQRLPLTRQEAAHDLIGVKQRDGH